METKREILQTFGAVLSALDNVSVSGKANMNNFAGCLNVLEGLAKRLSLCNIEPIEEEADENE